MSEGLEKLKERRIREREEELKRRTEEEREANLPFYVHVWHVLRARPVFFAWGAALIVIAAIVIQAAILVGSYFSAQNDLEEYNLKINNNDIEGAAKNLNDYLRYDADNWPLQIEYGVILVKLGRVEEANRVLSTAYAQSPGDQSANVLYYRALTNIKFDLKIIEHMGDILEKLPTYLPAMVVRAMMKHRVSPKQMQKEMQEAVEVLAELEPGSEIYNQRQDQLNRFLALACAETPHVFDFTVEDPSLKTVSTSARPVHYPFDFAKDLLPNQKYIYGIDNTVFMNFCGVTNFRLEKAAKDLDLSALVYMFHAFAQARAGNYPVASDAITSAKVSEEAPEILFLDGALSILRQQHQIAADKLEPIDNFRVPEVQIATSLALLHSSPKFWALAKEKLAFAVSVGGDIGAVALNNRGVFSLVEQFPGQARNDFNSALEIRKKYPHATYNIGVSLVSESNPSYADALLNFNGLIAERTFLPGLRYYTALCYHGLGKSFLAQSDLRYAVNDEFFSSNAYALRGDIFAELDIFINKAKDSYQSSYDQDPNDYRVAFKLIQALARTGESSKAAQLIENAQTQFNNTYGEDSNYKLLLNATQGEVLYELGDPDALLYLQQSYQTAEDPDLKVQLALLYSRLLIDSGDPERAEEIMRNFLSLASANVAIQVTHARALLASKNLGQAVKSIVTAQEQSPENFSVQLTAGEIHAAVDDVEAAVNAYELAHQLEPTNTEPIERQIAILEQHEPNSSRLRKLNDSLASSKLLAQASANAGDALAAQQEGGGTRTVLPGAVLRSQEGIAEVRKQIDQLHEDIKDGIIDEYSGLQNIAGLRLQVGDYENALKDMTEAVKVNQEHPSAWKNIARINVFLGNWEAAKKAYAQVLSLEPNNGQTYVALGQVESQLRNHKAAATNFGQALKFEPNNVPALIGYSVSLIEDENYEGALDSLTRVIGIDNDNGCAYTLRHRAYTFLNQRDRAIRDAEIISVLRDSGISTDC